MVYRLSVSYTANREVRVTSGVAVSYRREKEESRDAQALDISAKVQRGEKKTAKHSEGRKERCERPGWGSARRG